jgi:hypothetical protein
MVLAWMLKRVKKTIRVIFLAISRRVISVRYLFTKAHTTSVFTFEANLLVVKKAIYAPIAKVCIESFIHHNPNSSVTVHVDNVTKEEVCRKLKRLIKRGLVEVKLTEQQDQSWQDSKLDLILSLSDPKKFFMDADLKWNGPIPQISEITLFVDEFRFLDNPFYSPLFESPWFSEYSETSMKNTSFFYWGGYTPTPQDRLEIERIMNNILELTSDIKHGQNFNQSTLRISEQIALSLLVEKTGKQLGFLKKSDGFKDGSFVESSYFGATGASF